MPELVSGRGRIPDESECVKSRPAATLVLSRGIGISDTLQNHPRKQDSFPQKAASGIWAKSEFCALGNSLYSLNFYSKRLWHFLNIEKTHPETVKVYSRFWGPILLGVSDTFWAVSASLEYMWKFTGCQYIVVIHALTITLQWKLTLYKYLHLHGITLSSKMSPEKSEGFFFVLKCGLKSFF